MTAREYWNAIVARNPKLAEEETVTIKVSGIRAMVEQAHQKGCEHRSAELGKKIEGTLHRDRGGQDIFSSIFGGGK